MSGWQETKVADLVVGARMLITDCTIAEIVGIETRGRERRLRLDSGPALHVVHHEAVEVWACLPDPS
jgi:hypothetical protein